MKCKEKHKKKCFTDLKILMIHRNTEYSEITLHPNHYHSINKSFNEGLFLQC